MARYIDADALNARLQDFSKWCRDGRKQGVDFVLDGVLPDIPTADVAPKNETATELLDELDGFIKQIRVYDFINMPITYYSRLNEYLTELRTKYTEGKG